MYFFFIYFDLIASLSWEKCNYQKVNFSKIHGGNMSMMNCFRLGCCHFRQHFTSGSLFTSMFYVNQWHRSSTCRPTVCSVTIVSIPQIGLQMKVLSLQYLVFFTPKSSERKTGGPTARCLSYSAVCWILLLLCWELVVCIIFLSLYKSMLRKRG